MCVKPTSGDRDLSESRQSQKLAERTHDKNSCVNCKWRLLKLVATRRCFSTAPRSGIGRAISSSSADSDTAGVSSSKAIKHERALPVSSQYNRVTYHSREKDDFRECFGMKGKMRCAPLLQPCRDSRSKECGQASLKIWSPARVPFVLPLWFWTENSCLHWCSSGDLRLTQNDCCQLSDGILKIVFNSFLICCEV